MIVTDDFSFQILNDDCNDSLAAGYAATFFSEEGIDVIFGPVCNSGRNILNSLSKICCYYSSGDRGIHWEVLR